MKRHLLICLFSVIIFANLSCAFFGSNDDPEIKSKNISFSKPSSPYEAISVSSADNVWQSAKTGNTIAINSMCRKYQDLSLENLESNILAGIDNLVVKDKKLITFNGREAQRIIAAGTTDGIPIHVDLLILKKNSCTYDLTYIAREKTYQKEAQIFEEFLKGFKAP